jgi:hypothetical protein
MDRETGRTVFLVPVVTWAGLIAGVIFNHVYARIPGAPWQAGVTVFVQGILLVLVILVDMRVIRGPAVVRGAAAIGFAWLGFFFVLALADYFTR